MAFTSRKARSLVLRLVPAVPVGPQAVVALVAVAAWVGVLRVEAPRGSRCRVVTSAFRAASRAGRPVVAAAVVALGARPQVVAASLG